MIGFTGSRRISNIPPLDRFFGGPLAVGDADGADLAVVRAAISAGQPDQLTVYAVGGPGSSGPAATVAARAGARVVWWAGGNGRIPTIARLASRSAFYVREVALSPPRRGFVGFVDSPCPEGLAPGPLWANGFGSGSWASLALAAGLGVPLVAFWCGGDPPVWPGWLAPADSGRAATFRPLL